MKKLLLFLLSGLLMVAVSCEEMIGPDNPGGSVDPVVDSSDPSETPIAPSSVVFSAKIGDFSSSPETKVAGSSFEDGDSVGITAKGGTDAVNVKYSFEGGILSSVSPIVWPEAKDVMVDFYAMYPFDDKADPGETFTFDASADQSNGSVSSDLLVASASSAYSEAVNLAFSHAMSRVVLKIDGEVEKVVIDGVGLSASVNIPEGKVTPLEGTSSVIAYNEGSGLWTAVVAPQEFIGRLLVTVKDGGQQVFEIAEACSLASGYQIQSELSLTSPGKEGEAVPISFTIAPWQDNYNTTVDFSGAEHIAYLKTFNDIYQFDYEGQGIYVLERFFPYNEHSYFCLDLPNYYFNQCRGFDMSGPQFSGEWIATEIVYYWITRFPCFVTLRYDSYRDIFIFDMHDERNWTTVGTALYETDLLSCLGDFPAPQGSVSAVLQKNVFDETFFRILNPFAYAGVNSPGHIILQINEDNVSVPLSFTGVRFLPLPDEYPDVEGDLWLEGSGTIDEDNVLHFAEAGLIPWSDWNGSLPAIDIRLKFDE